MMAVDVVEDAGFRALEASNADAAVRLLEANSDIRILFTDLDLPGGTSGLELVELTRRRWPDVRIIVASGLYAPEAISSVPDFFFQKPYLHADLVAALTELSRR